MKNQPLSQNRIDYLNSHGSPLSRRDFISRGLAGAAGVVLAPSLYGLFVKSAMAEMGVTASFTPSVLVFDLAGGAGLPGNFLVGKTGGAEDLLKSYDNLGWDPRASDALDSRFGLPMAKNMSKVLEGMLATMSAEAQDKFRWGSILHVARDDTSENPLSILGLLSASGAVGTEVLKPLGQRLTPSGGNSRPVKEYSEFKAYYVSNISDLNNAVGLSNRFGSLKPEGKSKLAAALRKLSTHQATRLLGTSMDERAVDWVKANYKETEDKVGRQASLDPRMNETFQNVYGINAQTNAGDQNVLRAALVMNSLTKATGPAVITIDGCDYHDGTQTSGDNKDLEIGREIGRAIESAHRLKTPLMIHVLTDGGVYPQTGSRIWQGDQGEKCMSLVGVYHPSGAVPYRTKTSMQIGAYTDGQGADRTTIIGDNPALAGYACFANYLSFCGRINEFEKMVPGVFTSGDLDKLLIFS